MSSATSCNANADDGKTRQRAGSRAASGFVWGFKSWWWEVFVVLVLNRELVLS